MEQIRNAYKILVGKTEGRGHWEDLRVNGKIILKGILQKQRGKV